jgi:hypothetical protein
MSSRDLLGDPVSAVIAYQTILNDGIIGETISGYSLQHMGGIVQLFISWDDAASAGPTDLLLAMTAAAQANFTPGPVATAYTTGADWYVSVIDPAAGNDKTAPERAILADAMFRQEIEFGPVVAPFKSCAFLLADSTWLMNYGTGEGWNNLTAIDKTSQVNALIATLIP